MSYIERERIRARLERERAAAEAAGQLPLDLGSYYTDGKREFHGAQAGVVRHTELGEDLCEACLLYVADLAAAGLARPVGPAPDVEAARQLNGNRIPKHSPYQLHDWVQLHGYPGEMPGPRQTGWRGYVTGYLGATILSGVTDDGTSWAEYWGWLAPDGTPGGGVVSCTCCPRRRQRGGGRRG